MDIINKVLKLIIDCCLGTNNSNEKNDNSNTKNNNINTVSNFNVKNGFSVTGVSYYQDNFKKVLVRNNNYDIPLSKVTNDIYEYNLFETFNDVSLIEEPTNEYDTNAIYVSYKGLKLGYIKKGSTARVRNLLKKEHKIKIVFYGGNVKGILGDRKVEEKKSLGCKIEIYTRKEQ